MTAGARLAAIFLSRAERPALLYRDRTWTYAELLAEGWRRARCWRARGAGPETRILLAPGERLEFLFGVLAGALGGYELVSVSQKATAAEVEYIKTVTRPELEWNSCSSDLPGRDSPPDGVFRNIRIIFFTSGTTSRPKGIYHDLETLLANAEAFNRRAGLDASVRMLHAMPTGYMAGLLNTFLAPLMAGGLVVLTEAFDVRNALDFWKTAQRGEVNALWLTPTMVATLVPLCRGEVIPAWARANLRHVFVGTAPLHAATREAFLKRLGVDCRESYGMTECMFISVNVPGDPNPRHTVGFLLDGVEGEARSQDGRPLPPGQEGDIWVRSAYAMSGYLEETGARPPETTARNRDWLATGDIGWIDEGGRVAITGRRKDLILHGGTNVSPKTVEDVLLGFPGVQAAAVVGVPHPFWGEEVLACLLCEPGTELDLRALRAHCVVRMNADAVPARFLRLADFPRSSSGKVQKHLLRGL